MKKIVTWVLFITGGLLLLGIFLENPGPPAADSSRSPADVQQSRAAEEGTPFSVDVGDTTYYGATSSDVSVAVLGVASGQYLMGTMTNPIRADGKFVIVTMLILNQQNTAITVDNGLFEILDASGNVYSASEQSMEVDPANSLFLAQINPGVHKTGKIVFDVPRDLGLDNLRFRFRGGMTGHSAEIPLRVTSKTQQGPNTTPGYSY